MKKLSSQKNKSLKSDETVIFNYAARRGFFQILYRDFQIWTFFLSFFKIPKILLEKK
jgi:hypothetical protein